VNLRSKLKRPQPMPYVLRLEADLIRRLEVLALSNDRSLSNQIRVLLAAACPETHQDSETR
jgi:hypothetical protein